MLRSLNFLIATAVSVSAFVGPSALQHQRWLTDCQAEAEEGQSLDRRAFLAASAFAGVAVMSPQGQRAEAIGPIKIDLENPKYTAAPCPKDRPIPGEKAMQGMQGLCVTVGK